MAQNRTLRARELVGKAILCQQELLEQRPSLTQNTWTLIESRTILATLQRESGQLDDAKRNFGDTLQVMRKNFEAVTDKVHQKIYYQVLLESTLLDCSRGGATSEKLAALAELLRDQESSLRKQPEQSIVRCRAVTSYLAIGQLLAASGATTAAIENFNRAEELIAPGLLATPGHTRLCCLKTRLETARGNALYQSGKRDEASAAAKEAVVVAEKLAGAEPTYFYELACALALEARLSAIDAQSAKAGVSALRKAVEFGFDNVYRLKNDEQLGPFRCREDFQMLVQETEKKAAARAVSQVDQKE
jgi:tetratricopeptide (TPR) repeat protein